MTSIWDDYPPGYRSREIQAILSAVRAGDCVSVVGLSGAGKSNLIGFLYHRCNHGQPSMVLVDGNLARQPTSDDLLQVIAEQLLPDPGAVEGRDTWDKIEREIGRILSTSPGGLCLLVDRFDVLSKDEQTGVTGPLRALRDRNKYRLTYVVTSRQPLDPNTELAELFYANTLWLGPLQAEDALWSARQFAYRRGLAWDQTVLDRLVQLSWGYPSLLRACCEAYAAGSKLDANALKDHPAVQRRVREFWSARPDAEALRLSGLDGQPLLAGSPFTSQAQAPDLTASEHRLLFYFQAHPNEVCPKDDLIRAVWPDDRVQEGLRDDSLAQLIRRLRQKIDRDAGQPSQIQTLPGRGYRYQS